MSAKGGRDQSSRFVHITMRIWTSSVSQRVCNSLGVALAGSVKEHFAQSAVVLNEVPGHHGRKGNDTGLRALA
jgi:hypothetical protein